ncbi:hypothetical protein [Lysinibacillus sp. NPDC092081]|uniref:hypothetical protein n=1 Tax=Lysinibacillus sp. NPDC092081 TaxID=3364131 RepID=UPI003830D667
MMKNYRIQDLQAQKSLLRLAFQKEKISMDEYYAKMKELEILEEEIIRENKIKSDQLNTVKKQLKNLALTY